MAKAQKYNTIDEVIAATGVALTEQTRPFLESFVKKQEGESANAKKKALLQEAELFGLTGLDADNENVTALQIKIITFLFENGRADEMKEFAAKHNLYVTENGEIHRIKSAVKPIEQRNAGVKEGSVGYNTLALLRNPEFAGLTATELAAKQGEVFGQNTTASCVQWYINYANKKKGAAIEAKAAAVADGSITEESETAFDAAIAYHTICDRKKATKTKTPAAEAGVCLGAQLTLEKAMKPRGFKKKTADLAALGEELPLGEEAAEAGAGEEAPTEE